MESKEIESITEINYGSSELINFEATVIEIQKEGMLETKSPIRVVLKLESSGENFLAVSWEYSILDTLKELLSSVNVARFYGNTGTSTNMRNQQVRINAVSKLEKTSEKKVIMKVENAENIKSSISLIINKYVKNRYFLSILENLLLNNEKFFEWPAATRVHHNYPGGLAEHSLNVCKNAISQWEIYKGQNIDIEILVTGALLHDIGKLDEYKKDGSRTVYGDLIPHSVSGYERITNFAIQNNMPIDTDVNLIALKHIILSHHGDLEFGASVKPAILEAIIIHNADKDDSSVNGINKELINTAIGKETEKLLAADGAKILKLK